ncbi:MAG: hypothetical protein AB1440_28305 [Pseudomonadota bacterium]|jgi:hypothetical protein
MSFSANSTRTISGIGPDDGGSMLIAATRTDGLGGRLLAMVNAKSLADRLGCRFGFTWNSRAVSNQESHSVDVVRNVFSEKFIDRHWLGEKISRSCFGVLGEAAFTPASLDTLARQRRLRGWICDEFDVLDNCSEDGAGSIGRSETLRAFGFSPRVRQALDAAASCRFPGPMAALHLRSGDIVRGHHRRSLVFANKVIPSTLARAIVTELSSRGLKTLLVGQDQATLDYIKAETGALLATDFGSGELEGETANTFFQMALMARCQQIHAGGSIYAVVASVMGDRPCIGADALFGQRSAAEIVLEELRTREAHYHPLEAAFGYQWALLSLEDEIGPARTREILGRALALDPENDGYPMKIAGTFFREGNHAAGEAILKSVMTAQSRRRTKIPLPVMEIMERVAKDRFVSRNDIEALSTAAKAGHPYAMGCCAYLLAEVAEDRKSGLEMAARLLAAEPGNPIFRRIRQRVALGKKPEPRLLARIIWRLGWLRPPWR